MLNGKAKVRDVHKYLVAVHHVTVKRMEEAFKKHLEEIRKLQSRLTKNSIKLNAY